MAEFKVWLCRSFAVSLGVGTAGLIVYWIWRLIEDYRQQKAIEGFMEFLGHLAC